MGYLGKLGENQVWILMENDTDLVMSSHLREVIVCNIFIYHHIKIYSTIRWLSFTKYYSLIFFTKNALAIYIIFPLP